MFSRVKCFFGKHRWKLEVLVDGMLETSRHGVITSDVFIYRCTSCGKKVEYEI